jgi:Tfp pilus assembly protein PilO
LIFNLNYYVKFVKIIIQVLIKIIVLMFNQNYGVNSMYKITKLQNYKITKLQNQVRKNNIVQLSKLQYQVHRIVKSGSWK